MKLTWHRQALRPRHRFATSQGGIDWKETLVVELSHEGLTGRGEAVPSRLYGQTLEACEAALAELAQPGGELGEDPFALESILARLIRRYDAQRAVLAALDSALHDWVGQRLGVPVWRLLGLERPSRSTTFTIGVAEPAETREKVREALADGYESLKVKIGVASDHETLAMIRTVFSGPLLLDANQAWTPGAALEQIRALAPFRPTLIEQPLPQVEWRELARLRNNGVAPIYADESCERPADVLRLHGCVDGVNIKFTKCGGIREALRMIALARALGLQIMLGCFVSSSLAIAPALALATLVDHADLDGALLLADDPFEGITRQGGVLRLGAAPGLGVRPRTGPAPVGIGSPAPPGEIE
jgi:L-alanine-DL-glutamate epimerase-like enolase superfamily enzyme